MMTAATSETEQPLRVRVALALGWGMYHEEGYNHCLHPDNPMASWLDDCFVDGDELLYGSVPRFDCSLDACVPPIEAYCNQHDMVDDYANMLSNDVEKAHPGYPGNPECCSSYIVFATAEQRCRAFLSCVEEQK